MLILFIIQLVEVNKALKHYTSLMNKYKKYIDTWDSIYKIDSDEINSTAELYKEIKDNLIDPGYFTPQDMIRWIEPVGMIRLKYRHSYLEIMKRLYDEYHCNEAYDIIHLTKVDIDITKSLIDLIIKDDEKMLADVMKQKNLNLNEMLMNCCKHASVKCFRLLIDEFKAKITKECLDAAFLGNNQYIIEMCLREQKPDSVTMENAITSHNMENVMKLMNEYGIAITIYICVVFTKIFKHFYYI